MDYYGDGTRYDAENVHIRGDIPYYTEVAAQTGGDILELACGTGRLSFPMASTGARIWGLDLAPSMIARAASKLRTATPGLQARLHFSVGDMRDIRLGRTFDAVVLGFNTLMHMVTDDDLEAALTSVRKHLKPGGRFYFDVNTPGAVPQARDPNERFDPQQMIDPATGARTLVSENNRYDPKTQINTMFFYYQPVDRADRRVGEEQCAEIQLRVIYPRELDLWLRSLGFKIVEDWDSFERTEVFSGCGGRRVVVARRG